MASIVIRMVFRNRAVRSPSKYKNLQKHFFIVVLISSKCEGYTDEAVNDGKLQNSWNILCDSCCYQIVLNIDVTAFPILIFSISFFNLLLYFLFIRINLITLSKLVTNALL